MKLTFLGGADEVGASSTLVEIAGKRLLIDAGIRISPKTVRGISGDQLPDLQQVSDADGPDYILVTHAHTDHTGALPLVLEQYPDVPVIATAPTIALTKVLQADAQLIMKNKQEQEGELPLFDEIAVTRLLDAFQEVDFRQPLHLGDGLQATFFPAGHILGAAMIAIESDEGVLLMSGDLSLTPQRAVVKAELPRIKADFLVMESTYGGRLHANRAAEEKRLVETLQGILERGGKAIIPAFALGRAQEVIQILLAYSDDLDVPVWVDGMVRAVCNAYSAYQELLPKNTVKAARDDHLFFRKKVRAIKSPVQREEIAHSEGPAIIISSSGMLTGGPSVGYAKWLAEDERNAILLTGYQDEEAPGRFVQRMVTERQAGQAVTLKLDDRAVDLRCELGTYSLSAHADEAELVSIVENLGVEAVALVHGDSPARSSLSAALRLRQKRVYLPVSGTSIELSFPKRPWAMGVQSGSQRQPLDPAALWESLKDRAGSYFSARQLAQAWWGDAAREDEVINALAHEGVYFAQSWRRKDTFQVRHPDKVELAKQQRVIMAAHPQLTDKVIVLRDVNDRVRMGVVKEVRADGFKATVAKAKGQNYPATALIWEVAPFEAFPRPDDKGFMGQLTEILRQAEALREVLLPLDHRRALLVRGEPVDPRELIPQDLPEEVNPPLAELAIVLALAHDGARPIDGRLQLSAATTSEPMEMNLARKTALALFPPEARLR
ncbi:MAG: MBL fold metallo-hydrolase, partial [Chloroflexi bacterium]|nr:MBL fold metallo-hydrolase [Chloroflexota bacterium]